MKKIIALCAVLALLAPVYAFAHGDTVYRLQRKWNIEQAQQQQELPSFRGIEAGVNRAMKLFQTQEPIFSK